MTTITRTIIARDLNTAEDLWDFYTEGDFGEGNEAFDWLRTLTDEQLSMLQSAMENNLYEEQFQISDLEGEIRRRSREDYKAWLLQTIPNWSEVKHASSFDGETLTVFFEDDKGNKLVGWCNPLESRYFHIRLAD